MEDLHFLIYESFQFLLTSCKPQFLTILKDTVKLINEVHGTMGMEVACSIKNKLAKNSGLQELTKIGKIHRGENVDVPYCAKEIGLFKYAPIVSCFVELSFNVYKDLITFKRMNFTEERITYDLIIVCNPK